MARFEPAIPEYKLPKTHALDRSAQACDVAENKTHSDHGCPVQAVREITYSIKGYSGVTRHFMLRVTYKGTGFHLSAN